MSLFKLVFRLVFKWLFQVLTSMEQRMDTPRGTATESSYRRNGRSTTPPVEETAATMANRFSQTVEHLEKSLEAKLERLAENTCTTTEPQQQADWSEISDLRAELAELRTDIRSLKRMTKPSSDHEPPDSP